MKLVIKKSKFCDACDYSDQISVDVPSLKLTHADQERLLGELTFPPQPFEKGHKHHMIRQSWVEVEE